MSDKSVTTLKQTHSELCQGQLPSLIKFWTFNLSLQVAPINHSTRRQRDPPGQADPVV